VRIHWFGQSAFLLTGERGRIAIDPFRPATPETAARFRFGYPQISGVDAELLLVTHEHFDHNGVDAIGGDPQVLRSTAGAWEDTPFGTVVGVASEHDPVAGTRRGPNTIFVFEVDGLRVSHFGDLGQPALRPEQREAIGRVDVLVLPVGGGPTLDGAQAATVAGELEPRLVVPMHYRTPAIDFLETADDFLARFADDQVVRLEDSDAEVEPLLGEPGRPKVAVLAPPLP
jgi:L-ascorbate metabolism protein UlaG (beta-lactamase superfamily)